MGRLFLISLAVMAFAGAFAAHFDPPGKRSAESVHVATADERAPVAAQNGAAVPFDGNAIALGRNGDGHFYADVEINGATVHMLVDTGASGVALSRDDARSAGIATSIGMNDVVGEGADGAVRGEQVRIDRMRLGAASAQGVDAVVLNAGGMSLLGQDFLQRFQSVEIKDDRMILR